MKNTLMISALVAGSALMVSCDDDNGNPIYPQDLGQHLSDATTFNTFLANPTTQYFQLLFSTGTGSDVIIPETGLELATSGQLAYGDKLDLQAYSAASGVTISGVSNSGDVSTISTLTSSTGKTSFSNLVLTESGSTISNGDPALTTTSGLFTMDVEFPAVIGTNATALSDFGAIASSTSTASDGTIITITQQGATSPAATTLYANLAALVASSTAQPTVSDGTSTFTLADGDLLFTDGTNLYVTDNANAPATLGTTTDLDISETKDVLDNTVYKLVFNSVAAKTTSVSGGFYTRFE